MNKIDQAVETFSNDHNCSQSILMTFGPEFGLPVEFARSIAAPFGAGISHQGEVCGAVTGAVMFLGLLAGRRGLPLLEEKSLAYSLALEFMDQFRNRCGNLRCRELLGYDVSDPEKLERVKSAGIFESVCPRFVRTSAEILVEMIEKYQTNG